MNRIIVLMKEPGRNSGVMSIRSLAPICHDSVNLIVW
jgi:hypothetical protein